MGVCTCVITISKENTFSSFKWQIIAQALTVYSLQNRLTFVNNFPVRDMDTDINFYRANEMFLALIGFNFGHPQNCTAIPLELKPVFRVCPLKIPIKIHSNRIIFKEP